MQATRRTAILALGAAGILAFPVPASVHPHIFADARLEVKIGPDNTVGSLRHVWRFDEVWSSGEVLLTFDANQDLKLDDAELEEAGRTFHESLADYHYFQFMTLNGKDVELVKPDRLMVTFEDGQMNILFESKPAATVKLAGKLDFGVYDPTFYIGIDFTDDANLAVVGLPAGCERSIIRPDADAVISQQSAMTEDFFADPGAEDIGKLFATRLELTCQAQG